MIGPMRDRREQFVRRHRDADAVCELNDLALPMIRQAHVGFDEIEPKRLDAMQRAG